MNLIVTHGPHFKTTTTTRRIMTDVLIALLPVSIASVIHFGLPALVLMLVGTFFAMATEVMARYGREGFKYLFKPTYLYGDGSAAVTGLILAHIVTPALPLWMVAIGSIIAILIGKQVYGGIGQNIFNPALVGRAVLFASFPLQMSKWIHPDGVAGATPLVTGESSYLQLFTGQIGGCLGETSALAILLGALYLFYRGHIKWQTPVAYLGSTAILSYLLGTDPLFAVLAGGVAYGAFFMATDMTTTPITRNGQFTFGLGCGIITVIIREFGGFPEGVMFSILLMNALTPLIDRIVKPKIFGGEASA